RRSSAAPSIGAPPSRRDRSGARAPLRPIGRCGILVATRRTRRRGGDGQVATWGSRGGPTGGHCGTSPRSSYSTRCDPGALPFRAGGSAGHSPEKEHVMKTAAKLCYDRILPRYLATPHLSLSQGPGRIARAISPIKKQWANGTTIKIGFKGG